MVHLNYGAVFFENVYLDVGHPQEGGHEVFAWKAIFIRIFKVLKHNVKFMIKLKVSRKKGRPRPSYERFRLFCSQFILLKVKQNNCAVVNLRAGNDADSEIVANALAKVKSETACL